MIAAFAPRPVEPSYVKFAKGTPSFWRKLLQKEGRVLAFFLQEFDLLPTLQNFRKRALGVPLGNLT